MNAAAKPGPPHNHSDDGNHPCPRCRALEARVEKAEALLQRLNYWCDDNLSAPLSDCPELMSAQSAARAALRALPPSGQPNQGKRTTHPTRR